ncbi:lanthionine synthetase C family protein [Actinokineospora sp.]|uniref:lanthionine synthetase C family protein n=1 Tax=Actinokineospora sp. TaxID=1872133 RepID=UPI0040378773
MSHPNPQALAAATAIATQLADPDTVYGMGGVGRRRPQSLAGGAAGIALLHIERARTGHGDPATAHAWLTVAARDALSAGGNASLYFGTPALAFVTHAAAARPGQYARALADLDTSVIALTRRRLDTAHARIEHGERPALAEFDLIRGLAGLGAHHLRRHPEHEITRAVLAYLVRLTEPPLGRTDGLPGWWTDVSPNGAPSPDFPGGHSNQGMSHGICGPLTVLALGLQRGITVNGQMEAIGRICTWLDTWAQDRPGGRWWPGYITLDQALQGHIEQSNQRASWCYGTPGVARAQQLAGLATSDTTRQHGAEAAMLACLRDPAQLDRLTDPGLCHGTSGMLQTACRMAADAPTPDLAGELPNLTARLLTQLSTAPDDPELLDGRTGIALALHTAATGAVPLTSWDAFLLMA